MKMAMILLLLFASRCSSQLHNYFMYTPYGVPPSLSLAYPVYSSASFARDTPLDAQYQTTPWNSATADYNPSCQTECHSSQYCQRLSPSSQCIEGCCNSGGNGRQSGASSSFRTDTNSNGLATQNNAISGMFFASAVSISEAAADTQNLQSLFEQQSNERSALSDTQTPLQSASSNQNNATTSISAANLIANSSMTSPSAPALVNQSLSSSTTPQNRA